MNAGNTSDTTFVKTVMQCPMFSVDQSNGLEIEIIDMICNDMIRDAKSHVASNPNCQSYEHTFLYKYECPLKLLHAARDKINTMTKLFCKLYIDDVSRYPIRQAYLTVP
jgi:hypothetical protein